MAQPHRYPWCDDNVAGLSQVEENLLFNFIKQTNNNRIEMPDFHQNFVQKINFSSPKCDFVLGWACRTCTPFLLRSRRSLRRGAGLTKSSKFLSFFAQNHEKRINFHYFFKVWSAIWSITPLGIADNYGEGPDSDATVWAQTHAFFNDPAERVSEIIDMLRKEICKR